jgi:hypothetical protein
MQTQTRDYEIFSIYEVVRGHDITMIELPHLVGIACID